ncbi:MAG: M50 family metallopeptidase [Candidatus Methanoperedens sp.]
MYIILLLAIVLYLISEYLHRSLSSSASKTLYVVLMLPGTIVHEFSHALVALLMGARITNFSVIPSGDTLGRVEHTNPKIPVIGNFAISIAPLIGCPAILLLISKYLGIHFNYLPGSFDILTETLSLLEGSLSFIMGLDYLNWKTYVFLYLALALGAGAAPSKKDITYMIPGLIIIVVAILALNYFGINIPYLNIIVSWISVALTIAIIPLLTITAMVAMLRLIAVVK